MNLGKLSRQYSNKERCRELLRRLRRPDGVRCPRCQHSMVSLLTTEEEYECGKFYYQFSVTAPALPQERNTLDKSVPKGMIKLAAPIFDVRDFRSFCRRMFARR